MECNASPFLKLSLTNFAFIASSFSCGFAHLIFTDSTIVFVISPTPDIVTHIRGGYGGERKRFFFPQAFRRDESGHISGYTLPYPGVYTFFFDGALFRKKHIFHAIRLHYNQDKGSIDCIYGRLQINKSISRETR